MPQNQSAKIKINHDTKNANWAKWNKCVNKLNVLETNVVIHANKKGIKSKQNYMTHDFLQSEDHKSDVWFRTTASSRVSLIVYTHILLYRILFKILLFTCGKNVWQRWITGKRPTYDRPEFEICLVFFFSFISQTLIKCCPQKTEQNYYTLHIDCY